MIGLFIYIFCCGCVGNQMDFNSWLTSYRSNSSWDDRQTRLPFFKCCSSSLAVYRLRGTRAWCQLFTCNEIYYPRTGAWVRKDCGCKMVLMVLSRPTRINLMLLCRYCEMCKNFFFKLKCLLLQYMYNSNIFRDNFIAKILSLSHFHWNSSTFDYSN